MLIKKAEFVKSFSVNTKFEDFSLPEIAIVGRSNVGKSSIINMLARQSKLAKTSSLPGRTRLINYFKFNDTFILVDLPGYGFAKASKSEIDSWGKLIEDYLKNSKNLKHVLLLVDSRIPPTEKDIQMMKWLYFYNISCTVVATKCDKLSKAERAKNKTIIASTLKVGIENVIFTSAEKRIGEEELLTRIEQFV